MRAKFFLVLSLLFAGCATAPTIHERVSEAVSQGVYATNDSLHVGRVDLAYKYSDQTVRVVPPPKTRLKVLPFYAK